MLQILNKFNMLDGRKEPKGRNVNSAKQGNGKGNHDKKKDKDKDKSNRQSNTTTDKKSIRITGEMVKARRYYLEREEYQKLSQAQRDANWKKIKHSYADDKIAKDRA